MHCISRQAVVLVFLWLQCQAVKAPDPLCMDSAGTGCSWAAERSWHAPLSHGLRRLRLRRRQGWWWMGCRPCLPSSFDRAAVICYRATVASINFWHMHTCTLTTTDLPLLRIQFHPFCTPRRGNKTERSKIFECIYSRCSFQADISHKHRTIFFSQEKNILLFFCQKCTFTVPGNLRNLNQLLNQQVD